MTKDITGQRFGRLTVKLRLPNEKGRSSWYCTCDCGGIKIIDSKALVTGKTASCGCLRMGHGMTGTLLHKVWASMRERCNNPKSKAYKHYGARGIKVCARWDDFELFLKDMGPRPLGHSIDRKDNNGDYEPSNCYWATDLQQMNNTRRSRYLTAGGETKTMSEWTRQLGAGPTLIINRFKYGWTEEEACLTPVGQSRSVYSKGKRNDPTQQSTP